jgi:chromosome segregation ATPase
MREYNSLEEEETKISQELTSLRRRFGEMNRVKESALTTMMHYASKEIASRFLIG